MANLAIVAVSHELLIEMFHFPEGTRIMGIKESDLANTVELVIEHSDLPAVGVGCQIPHIKPRYLTHHQVIDTVTFDGWV